MTTQRLPSICDFCAQEIVSEMRYRLDINQKSKVSIKGQFVKCSNSADMCHTCFMEVCTNGFKPKWVKLVKDEATGKWIEREIEYQSRVPEYETQ
jgi:hypothetical protein